MNNTSEYLELMMEAARTDRLKWDRWFAAQEYVNVISAFLLTLEGYEILDKIDWLKLGSIKI